MSMSYPFSLLHLSQISNQFFLYFTSEQFKFTHQTNTYKGNIRIFIWEALNNITGFNERKKMNGTYDNYHRRLRKFRISIQVLMILSVCVLTALSIFRIYMLNGFETQWPFQKATKCHVNEDKNSIS